MKKLAVVVVAALALTGCGHAPPPTAAASPSTDQLGSLEASVDAIAGQVDSDSSG